ncbi:hypothetical protein [Planomonospora parontospora]|uniref:hypothetical protein n=1 Tax=Planomonospora parontospora TaxID=58119 RepID=UPI0019B9C7F5|nr:hypothetical protein [Planomonospora parontospora]GGL55912.1 hypothetical protein GCM10014719_66510 [Planomonospora parontospora subsp. antibiotica]GII18738.1 hypothetical protein Ppa05_54640 [Planomonospora parontospora subsp. antibiotica]
MEDLTGLLGGAGGALAIEVTVRLPAGSRIGAKAAAAEFRAVGRLGEVAFEGAQGQIKVDEAAGVSASLNAGTGYGRIDNALASNGAPELDIHATTAYGDIVARSL